MRLALGISIAALLLSAAAPTGAGAASAPTPNCAAGPARVGDTIVGTPCADTIVAPPGVEDVKGGGGDDTIVPSPVAAAVPCAAVCLGVGSQTFEGGPGDDVVYGERGNDTLRGGAGNDRLYGGIGDDLLEGGPGDDLLAGGFGADSIDGQEGSDYVRGDGTIDHIRDTGLTGVDTLSYASGVVPGFGGGIVSGIANFPNGPGGERGVYLNLGAGGLNGNNGVAGEGGGVDEVEPGAFETIVGTPFSDYIVGGEAGETIYGGGGADAIEGGGGDDHLFGGADGDYLDGGPGANTVDGGSGSDNCQNPDSSGGASSCAGTAKAVAPREAGKVSVGLMAPGTALPSQLYVTGDSGNDTLTATYAPGTVTFSLSGGSFDTSAGAESGCTVSSSSASCPVGAVDSIVLAGLGGADHLTATGFPQEVSVVLLGGEGEDTLTGGEESEDLLVDGAGESKDTLSGLGRDDALLHEGGPDQLLGGEGNDLLLSVSICDGETLDGGEGRDNASWARLPGEGVEARLDNGRVGRFGASGSPGCGGAEQADSMVSIEDLEGSEAADLLVGDSGPNQLLGHKGPDEYFAGGGEDSILANSADSDPVIDCGADFDTASIDIPTAEYADATPIECESVHQGAPEDFRTVTELPPPPVPAPPPSPTPAVDRKPPATRIVAHPAKVLRAPGRRRRVVFRFASSEPGSGFRCKLDRKPYRPCASPRAYAVAPGRHSVRIFATDAGGNADPTPVLFRFRVIRQG
jgi:Ca2+-binding RTX toxin-like protein